MTKAQENPNDQYQTKAPLIGYWNLELLWSLVIGHFPVSFATTSYARSFLRVSVFSGLKGRANRKAWVRIAFTQSLLRCILLGMLAAAENTKNINHFIMRVITGLLGGLFMFVAVFLLTGLVLLPFLPGFLRPSIHLFGFGTNNVMGVVLGLLAAGSSYRAATKKKKP